MTRAQEARINGYYWIEHVGVKQFSVQDADIAGDICTFDTRRDAEKYILSLQDEDDERTY